MPHLLFIGYLLTGFSLLQSDQPFEPTLHWSDDFVDFPGQRWVGEQIRFEPEILDGRRYLRQIGHPEAGSHFIAADSPVHFGIWEFSIRFDGFTSSNQNRIWVWLAVNDPENPHGYAVRLGESGGQKYVRIFRLNGESAPTEILRSNSSMPDGNTDIHVRVERRPEHHWKLGVRGTEAQDYDWAETIFEDVVPWGRHWFGFRTHFTATRADRFLFGGIRIWQYPIFVTDTKPLAGNRIRIQFSESLPGDLAVLLRTGIRLFLGENEVAFTPTVSIEGALMEVTSNEVLRGGIYTISVPAFTNSATGNTYQGGQYDIKVFDEPDLFDVVINEFTPRPDLFHFVELLNRSNKLLNLHGWIFGRQQQTRMLSHPDEAIVLEPGGIAVLGLQPGDVINSSSIVGVPIALPVFGQNQDRLWLQSNSGELIDSISYSADWVKDLEVGVSLERVNPEYAGGDRLNWLPSLSVAGHTAGFQNSHNPPETVPLDLIYTRVMMPNTIEIVFNQFVSLEKATIRIDHGSPEWLKWSPWSGNRVLVGISAENSWLLQREISLVAENVSVFGSHELGEQFQSPVAQPPQHGDLIINEIMYQPLQNRYSLFADQSEYIEIRNVKPYRIDLTDVYLTDTQDKNGIYRSWRHVSDYWYADAASFAVIYADTARNWLDTRVHQSFGATGGLNWSRVDRSTLGLTSSGRGVYLRNETGSTIDSVYYSPDWHHPYIRDPRGRSLERISSVTIPGSPGWTTSTASLGGTPDMPNSADMIIPAENPMVSGIIVSPNPFSPDNDGRDDHTLITIVPPSFGYLVRIDIFDRNGRLVRNLIGDTVAGREFTALWNGLDNSGRILGTGVYIVYAEGKKTDEPIFRYKETIVLVRGSP
jgi:hypothetical protein